MTIDHFKLENVNIFEDTQQIFRHELLMFRIWEFLTFTHVDIIYFQKTIPRISLFNITNS